MVPPSGVFMLPAKAGIHPAGKFKRRFAQTLINLLHGLRIKTPDSPPAWRDFHLFGTEGLPPVPLADSPAQKIAPVNIVKGKTSLPYFGGNLFYLFIGHIDIIIAGGICCKGKLLSFRYSLSAQADCLLPVRKERSFCTFAGFPESRTQLVSIS